MAAFAIDRRKLLTGLALAPALAAVPALAKATGEASGAAEWSRLMAHHLAATRALADYQAVHVNPFTDHLPIGPARLAAVREIPRHVWDRVEVLANAQNDSQDALMAFPAPNVKALEWKLGIILEIEEDGFSPSWSAGFLAPVFADLRRLSGEA